MTDRRMLPTPAEMIAHLDHFVLEQNRAKQDISVAVYNHYLSQAYRDKYGTDLGRHHILLMGPTGVGKTYLVKRLSEYLDVPIAFTSATGLVEMGYKGNSVESIVRSLLDRAGGDPRKAEKGIIFIDEIDKIKRGETGGRDVSGEGVQNALLTILDGRQSKGMEGMSHAAVDTSRLLFICAGAFVGLREIVDTRLGTGRSPFGFAARSNEDLESISDRPIFTTLCQTETSDLVEFGMIPELIGRFATLSVLHDLGEKDLRKIVEGQLEQSSLSKQQQLALIHGIELILTDDALDAIAAEAASLGTGARGLHRLIGRAVDAVDYRWHELAEDGICKVIIDHGCAFGTGKPELTPGASASNRIDLELREAAVVGLPRSPRPLLVESASQPRPSKISDHRNWSDEQIWNRIESLKTDKLKWSDTSSSAQIWWTNFEDNNRHRPTLILRVVEELQIRKATINDFFFASLYSNTDNIQANLHYMDYMRLKEQHPLDDSDGDAE